MPDLNNLYSMDEQIYEDKDDDEEVDTLDDLDGGQEESAINNFLSNGSITEEEYGRRKRVPAARLSQISRLKGLQIKTTHTSLAVEDYHTTIGGISGN